MKACKKCNRELNVRGVCQPCKTALEKEWRTANPDKLKERRKKYYEKNKDKVQKNNSKWHEKNIEKVKAYNASWRILNSEKLKQDNKKYVLNNKEKVNAYKARWAKLNKEKIRAASAKWYLSPKRDRLAWLKRKSRSPEAKRSYSQNRRARERLNNGKLSSGLAEKLFDLQHGKCVCCGKPLGNNYHMDHIMPLALGGANEDWNIQLLTKLCNNQKHAKHPIDFMQSRGFLL